MGVACGSGTWEWHVGVACGGGMLGWQEGEQWHKPQSPSSSQGVPVL